MASSLLALIDDIATLLDDVALLTKVAAKKTAGVLGDDLALNAQQVSGVSADRELPVVWAVARGSMLNKLILVPSALAISAFIPWAVTPLLMVGGAFLCYEGFEKLAHRFFSAGPSHAHGGESGLPNTLDAVTDVSALEKERIKGAVRTDFILSAEIVAISLGTVQASPFTTQVAVLSGIAIAMTVGVYGLVAGIVKLDDAGLHLSQLQSAAARLVGRAILVTAPWLMRGLSVAGTAAMFLVGGGILSHGIALLQQSADRLVQWLKDSDSGALFAMLAPLLVDAVVGLVAGGLVFLGVSLARRIRQAVPNT